MLNIQLEDIKEKGLLLEGEANPDVFPQLSELIDAGEIRLSEPIRYRLKISRLADMIEVEGQIQAVVELACGRCLDRYDMPFSTQFFLGYTRQLPEVVDEEGSEMELSADELGLTLIEGTEISLIEPLQEQILMALPIRPLCREDCRGLCPVCGGNRNESECDCVAPPFDTRFASLKDFKVRKKDS